VLVLLFYQAAEAVTPNGTARLSFKGFSLIEAMDEDMQPKEPLLKRTRKCLDSGIESKDDGECPVAF
jgi:hypothetical protein